MVTNSKNFNVTYNDVTYNVSLNTKRNLLFVDGSFLCPFQYEGIEWENEQNLFDEIYDCVGGWAAGNEKYSLRDSCNEVRFPYNHPVNYSINS